MRVGVAVTLLLGGLAVYLPCHFYSSGMSSTKPDVHRDGLGGNNGMSLHG